MVSNFQGRSEVLQRMLAATRNAPTLSAEEEASLALAASAGDRQAVAQLVAANMGRVARLARFHSARGLSQEDLLHEGALGMLLAIDRFDPGRGVRFFTYAAYFVQRAMVEAIAHSCKTVRIPRGAAARARRQREALDATSQEDVPHATYEISLDERGAWLDLGIPVPQAEGPDASEVLLREEARAEVDAALAALPARERQVMSARYGIGQEPRTLRQLGAELRLSKERVRQLEERATGVLRQRLCDRYRRLPVA